MELSTMPKGQVPYKYSNFPSTRVIIPAVCACYCTVVSVSVGHIAVSAQTGGFLIASSFTINHLVIGNNTVK